MKESLYLLLLLLVSLSGCTALSALDEASQPLEIYELRPLVSSPSAARVRNVEVIVEEPIGSGALATERIMIRPEPLQAQYLPGVRWADTAPVMLQTLIVRSLTETGAFGSVGRSPVGTLADFAVLSELTDFQAEALADSAGATVRIRLVSRVVRESDARVVATGSFSSTENTEATDPDSVVAAFDRATAQLLSDLVPWIVGQIGSR